MSYNGGSVVAMIGKDCVAIASDLRLGQQAIGVAHNFEKVRPFVSTFQLINRSFLSTTSCTMVFQGWQPTFTPCKHVNEVRRLRADEKTCDSESTCTE